MIDLSDFYRYNVCEPVNRITLSPDHITMVHEFITLYRLDVAMLIMQK